MSDVNINWMVVCTICGQSVSTQHRDVKEDPKASRYEVGHKHSHGPCYGAAHIVTMQRRIISKMVVGSPKAESEIARRDYGGEVTMHITWLCTCVCGTPCFSEHLLLEENFETGVDSYSAKVHIKDHLTHGGFKTTIWRRLRTA